MGTKIPFHQITNILALVIWVAGMGCATASANADSLSWKFEYGKGDRITKVTDPAGRDTRMEYAFDESNRHLRKRVKIAADGVRVVHKYDTAGRISQMTDGTGSVFYGYDERGRLNLVQRLGAAAVAYTYDTQDRIASLQVGDFYRIEYTYDFLGRLSAMKTPAGTVEYEYRTGQGQVVRKLPNGVLTISAYDPNGQLRQITHGYARTPADTSYEVLVQYSYQYRPDGLITSIDERSNSGQFQKTYAYDTVGPLVNATGPNGQSYSYEYDLVGNRLKAVSSGKPAQTASYDWAGRMTRLDGATSTHDAAGNLAAITLGGESINYHYTPDNQLAEVGGKVSYRYDGDGRLISRKAGSVETTVIPDPLSRNWQPLVMETKGGERTLVVWEGTRPLMLIKNGKPEYLLHDHLGSVRLVTDGQGQVTRRFDYEPFGALLNSEQATEFAPRFAGLFWDAEAKAYLTLARGYRPDLGRFIGVDPQRRVPVGSQKDLSIYAYSGSDPVNFVDINGADPISINSQQIWWDTFFNSFEQNVFDTLDAGRAKETLAEWSASQLANARGSGVAAAATASFLDIWGGFIPGDVANEEQLSSSVRQQLMQQKQASLLWSVVTLGGEGLALKGFGFGQSMVGSLVFSAQGNYQDAALEIVSMGLTAGTLKFPPTPHGHQYALDFSGMTEGGGATKDLVDIDRRYKIGDFFKKAEDIFDWVKFGKEVRKTELEIYHYQHNSYTVTRNVGGVIDETQYGGNQSLSPSHVGGAYLGDASQIEKPTPPPQLKPKKPDIFSGWWGGQQQSPPPVVDGGHGGCPPDCDNNGSGNNGGRRPPPSPTPVGGVYLGGAGQLLQGLGELEGISKDANGNLILLGKSGADIKLPFATLG